MDTLQTFKNHFNTQPLLVTAPGRVNLIGEHTDYNEGFVMPAAIDLAISMAAGVNGIGKIRLVSLDKRQTYETEAALPFRQSELGWPNYVLGVIEQMCRRGAPAAGFDLVFGGDLPVGAGMSSSAALVGGIAFCLNELHGMGLTRPELALVAQAAENEFVGIRSGIMDQFASLNGRAGHALLLDCRSLETRHLPFPSDRITIVLCDTNVRRELASSEYNTRRAQCESCAAEIRKDHPEVRSLRDVSPDMIDAVRGRLDPVVYRRAKFVIDENTRTLAAAEDLARGDLRSFGERMLASHRGLQHEYQVSCDELDVLVELALPMRGVIGTRMMGGGFGGCTINLVENEHVEQLSTEISSAYHRKMGRKPAIYIAKLSEGTALV